MQLQVNQLFVALSWDGLKIAYNRSNVPQARVRLRFKKIGDVIETQLEDTCGDSREMFHHVDQSFGNIALFAWSLGRKRHPNYLREQTVLPEFTRLNVLTLKSGTRA